MVDKPNPTLLEAAKKVYNSYLLLHKLNELKVDELKANDEKKSLQEVISEAINKNKRQKEFEVKFKIKDKQYTVKISKKGNSYNLEVLGQHAKPEVKKVLKYTDEEIIGLWAHSEVSIEKDESIKKDQFGFAVGLQNLKVGGLGKKVPFGLRFSNFYEVIEILKDEKTPLKEKFRLANNIATGSGKTGDIALLKLWAYLTDTPCITIVPSDILRTQSNEFDKEFLPDKVAVEFAKPFTEQNTRFATTTFTEALDKQWNVLNNKYGKDNREPALILVDEAPTLKEEIVKMARSVYIARHNPTAFFSATPDAFLSVLFGIISQILLSPKKRTELGTGKLPVVNYHYMTPSDLQTMDLGKVYIQTVENTHEKLSSCNSATDLLREKISQIKNDKDFKLENLSQPFLDCVSQSLNSAIYKTALIAIEENLHVDVGQYIVSEENNESRNRMEKHEESFITAIKELKLGLEDEEIQFLVKENLNIALGRNLLPSIKLHNIIDTLNEYKKSGKEVTECEIKKFIQDKYGIVDYVDPTGELDNLPYNSKLTSAILALDKAQAEYQNSIERNYPGDKKLHEHIFKEHPDIKEFCEVDTCIEYFDGKVNYIGKGTSCYVPKENSHYVLNMIRAGFVPITRSKELAIGIDAPRLSRAAAIVKYPSDILNPMFLFQLIGRIGRDVERKGLCYFHMVTAVQSFLNIEDITKLSGKDLLKMLDESYENYIKDEESIIQSKSAALDYYIRERAGVCLASRRIGREATIGVQNYIKREFKNINIQYGYNKELSLKIFIEVLKKANSMLQSSYLNIPHEKLHGTREACISLIVAHHDIDDVIKILESKEAESSTIKYSDSMTLVDFARYIVQKQLVASYDDLLDQDPNSNAPIFMEQKERSQQRAQSADNAPEKGTPTLSTQTTTNKPQGESNVYDNKGFGKEIMSVVGAIAGAIAGAIIGATIAYLAGATLPIIAVIAVISAVPGVLIGCGIAEICEKVSGERKNDPEKGILTALSIVLTPKCMSGGDVAKT